MSITGTPITADATSDPHPRGPGLIFHVLLVLPAAVLLWSVSSPGYSYEMALLGLLTAGIAGLVWLIRLVIDLRARRRDPSERISMRRYIVSPIGGVIVVLLLFSGASRVLRWQASESAFEAIVRESGDRDLSPTEVDQLVVPRRIGLYGIPYAYRQGDAFIFHEATGAFLNDAGFAYLPSGPFPELESGSFERPRFEAVGNDWYRWVASW